MKLTDMHVTAEEKAEREVACCTRPDGYDGPDYPWGLGISLDGDSMAKLGMTEMPKIGEIVHLEAIAKVNTLSQNSSEDSDEQRNVGLQIMLLGVAPESQTKADAAKVYDGAGARKP